MDDLGVSQAWVTRAMMCVHATIVASKFSLVRHVVRLYRQETKENQDVFLITRSMRYTKTNSIKHDHTSRVNLHFIGEMPATEYL